jgi:hypothetical protein
MKIERTFVFGWEAAMEDMRNPYDSWADSDSKFYVDSPYLGAELARPWSNEFRVPEYPLIGPQDLELACKLIKRGSAHRKFMREIIIWVRLTIPRFVWQELDTYKVATTRNSCSTMNKLGSTDLEQSDFERPILESYLAHINEKGAALRVAKEEHAGVREARVQLKNDLPEGFLQRAGYVMSYETALKLFFDREVHRLPQWRADCPGSLCAWVASLPYMDSFIAAARRQ